MFGQVSVYHSVQDLRNPIGRDPLYQEFANLTKSKMEDLWKSIRRTLQIYFIVLIYA